MSSQVRILLPAFKVIKMKFEKVKIEPPQSVNLILGQTHFIKSIEDIAEVLVSSVPGIKFGLAFAEASGPCLIRTEANDKELEKLASESLRKIGAGHAFIIFMRNAFPINVLNQLKNTQEVCSIFCATANKIEVLISETDLGRAILGVVDGQSPKGVEKAKDKAERKEFLRKICYKL